MPRRAAPRRRSEPTIALINIVFLMLVFFLVAGRVAAPVSREVELVEADLAEARPPDDALVLRADGTTLWRGAPIAPEGFAAAVGGEGPLRLLPDRAAPAAELVAVAARLRAAAGDRPVRLVTARSLAR